MSSQHTGADLQPRLIMLTRVPRLGQVKTRLARHIGAPAALRAHVDLLRHNAGIAAASGLTFELHAQGELTDAWFAALVRRSAATVWPQSGGDIGERMLAAAAVSERPSLVIGSDCGGLSVDYLQQAVAKLQQADVVLGPAEDGGYVLIGQNGCWPALFENVDWGSARVSEQTRRRVRGAGLRLAELPLQWDVDGVADFRRWRRSTRSKTGSR